MKKLHYLGTRKLRITCYFRKNGKIRIKMHGKRDIFRSLVMQCQYFSPEWQKSIKVNKCDLKVVSMYS